MDNPPLGEAELIIVVVLVVEYNVLDDCFGSVSGHKDLVKDLTSQISGIASADEEVCLEDGFAVIVTSGLPPLDPELPVADMKPRLSLAFAVLLAVANTSAMLLLNVKGMEPDPDESLLFLNS